MITNEKITYQVMNMTDGENQTIELTEHLLAVNQLNRYRKANPDNRYRLIKITTTIREEFTQD